MDLFRSFPDSCVETMVGWLDGGSDRKKTGYVFQNPRLDGWIADRIKKNGDTLSKAPVGRLDGSVPVLPRLLCGNHGWMVGWRIGSKKNGVCFSKSQVGWLDSGSDRKKTGTLFRKPQLDGWMDLFRSFPESCVEIMVGWLDGGSDRKKTGYVFQNPRLDGWIADRIEKKTGTLFENPSWMVG